ncbi:MAG: hypothetical protein ACUVS5_06805, partial [Anaerolineae bacterium]
MARRGGGGRVWLWTVVLVVFLVGVWTLTLQAQSKAFFWRAFDVDVWVLSNGDLRIREVQEIEFTSGSFSFGFRSWPMDRLEAIADLSVSEPGRPYTPGQGPYQFTTYKEDGNFYVKWFFPPVQDEARTYILANTFKGALR